MKKILSVSFVIILFASCTIMNVYFTSPQPGFVDDLSLIPERFQGSFYEVHKKDTNTDSLIYVVTDITINGDKINDGNIVVKDWSNYLFVNTQDEDGVWDLGIIHLIRTLTNEEINIQSLHTDFGVDLTGFNVILNNDSSKYIVDNVSTLQFHYLLRMSNQNRKHLNRLENNS